MFDWQITRYEAELVRKAIEDQYLRLTFEEDVDPMTVIDLDRLATELADKLRKEYAKQT